MSGISWQTVRLQCSEGSPNCKTDRKPRAQGLRIVFEKPWTTEMVQSRTARTSSPQIECVHGTVAELAPGALTVRGCHERLCHDFEGIVCCFNFGAIRGSLF